jgi:hypothetical protein
MSSTLFLDEIDVAVGSHGRSSVVSGCSTASGLPRWIGCRPGRATLRAPLAR